jgi:hypothetical protein
MASFHVSSLYISDEANKQGMSDISSTFILLISQKRKLPMIILFLEHAIYFIHRKEMQEALLIMKNIREVITHGKMDIKKGHV